MSGEVEAVKEVSPSYVLRTARPAMPSGYKETDAGLIPTDWTSCRIDAHATIKTGSRNTQDRVDDGAYPFFVRSQQVEQINSYSYDGEAVLTAGDGVGTGKVFHYIDGKFDVHQRVYRISEFSKSLDGRYFYYQFSTRFHERIMSMTAKSSVDSVRMEMIAGMSIPLPSVDEQHAIATALSDVDALLEELDRLIAKKRDLKKATMQQLLTGQTRLPGFEGEWESRSLLEIADNQKALFDDGDWVEAEHITDQGIRLVQTGNIGEGVFVEKAVRKFIYDASFEKLKCKELKEGDVLICRLAEPAGRACLLPDIGENKIITSVDVTIFRPRPEVADRRFLVQFFSTNDWFKMVLDNVGGTTHKRISRGALGKLKIPFPPLPEQTAIADLLTDKGAEIQGLEQRRAKIAFMKRAMMQQLLTGRTRLI